jgi:O-antigen ligase
VGSLTTAASGVPAAIVASLVAGSVVAFRAPVAMAAAALAASASLVLVPAEVVVILGVAGRDLADSRADNAVAGGMNAGALIGIGLVAAAVARILTGRARRGALAAAFFSLLVFFWFAVGYTNFGLAAPLERELIRQLSIVAVAVVAANTVRKYPHTPLVTAVLLTTVGEALIAVYQFGTGRGWAGTDRAWGTLSHPSTASALLGIGLALAVFQYFEQRKSRYLAAAVALALGVLATRSLGGVIQAPVSLIAYGVLGGRLTGRVRSAAILGVLVLVVFVFTGFGSGRIQELSRTQGYTAASHGITTNSLDWRFSQWSLLIKDWHGHPGLGWGLGATDSFIDPQSNIPHNDFLRLLVETGVVGVIVFGIGWLVLVRSLYVKSREPSDAAGLQAVTLAILLGLTLNSAVNNINFQTSTMYTFAALVGCALAPIAQRGIPRVRRALRGLDPVEAS